MRGTLLVTILVAAAALLGWWVYSRWSGALSSKQEGPATQASGKQSGPTSTGTSSARTADDSNRIKSGPNYKPIEPILGASDTKKKQDSPEQQKIPPELDYGRTEPVRGDLSPQTRSIVEAVETKSHPERLSPLIPPKPFDPVSYKQNPKAYLDVVEPGRVFQTANPGKDVPKLIALSPQLQEVVQGKSVKLKVKAASGYPVTFTSFDLGRFHNDLTSVTVEANDDGIAEAQFFGATGTINEVNILASCPVASGQARFIVNVTKP